MFHRDAKLNIEARSCASLALFTLLVLMSPVGTLASQDAMESTEAARVAARQAVLDVPFIANLGQADEAVAYYAQTHAGTVFVTRRGELVYALRPAGERTDAQAGRDGDPAQTGWTLVEMMVGGDPRPTAGEASETRVSVFIGDDPAKWKSDIPAFQTVRFGEVWPGVEAEVRAHGKSVEKLFKVNPGAAAESIRVRINGHTRLSMAEDGSMIVGTGLGEARLSAPVAWQESEGRRRVIKVAYRLEEDGSYGFAVGDHDATLPVFIDPILQSTYLGGNGTDQIRAIATSSAGDILVAGMTNSTDFPGVSLGGAQPVKSGSYDAFVALLNPGLTSVIRSTYLGGSGSDEGHALVVSGYGVYLAGETSSSNFPGAAVGGDGVFGGSDEGFIAQFDDSLTTLRRSTYIGGSGSDVVYGIAAYPTDSSTGNIVVVGKTTSRDLPESSLGARSGYQGGMSDGFVAKFTPELGMLLVSTYFGGDHDDECRGVTLNLLNGSPYQYQVYVVGSTSSFNMPARGGFRPRKVNAWEGYAARLSNSLGVWEQGTYLGGDTGRAILIRFASGGSVYVAGGGGGVPGTAGGPMPVGGSGFVELLDLSLTSLIRATYIGGSGGATACSLAYQQGTDSIYVGGTILSDDLPGAETGAQPHHASANEGQFPDGFITRFNTSLTSYPWATYIGGRFAESDCVVLQANDSVYLAGTTMSDDIPSTAGGAQPTHSPHESQGFISRVSLALTGCPAPVFTVQPLSQTVALGTPAILTAAVSSDTPVSYQWYAGGPGYCNSPVGGNSPTFSTPPSYAIATYFVRVRNACGFTDSLPAVITVAGGPGVSPWIVTQPASRKVASGGSATLSVAAGGTAPLRYQWYRRSGSLFVPVGTNSSTYTTAALTSTGEYWVRVSNDSGTAASAVATITIPSPPTIDAITPSTARPGVAVRITSRGHTIDRGLLNVYFGDVRAPIQGISRTQITVNVPRVPPGRYQVYLISEGLESNKKRIRVGR
ncbi:MAG: SBBP repeat-containing protein [Acidobacteriota bacterium]